MFSFVLLLHRIHFNRPNRAFISHIKNLIANLDDNRIPYKQENSGKIIIDISNEKINKEIIILPPPSLGDLDISAVHNSIYMIC